MSNSIIIRNEGAGFSVAIPAEVRESKDRAIQIAKAVTQVTSQGEQEKAIAAASTLKGLSKAMEKTREEVKKPYLDAGRKIDKAAKDFSAELDEEAKRVEGLVAAYLKAERDRVEAERKAQEQAVAAAQRAVEEAGNEFDRSEAEDALQEVSTAVVLTQAPKPQGASTRQKLDFEVTDIAAFYAAMPGYVKMEVKRSELLSYLNGIAKDPYSIPGIKVFEKLSVHAKASL